MIPWLILATASIMYYFAAPSMPFYKITNIRLKRLRIDLAGRLHAIILAGIEIENDNIVGADLHSTIVNLYYPDWNGNLQHLGFATETKCIGSSFSSPFSVTHRTEKEDDRGMCLSYQDPFFTVKAKTISTSHPEAVTVYIMDVGYRTYLHMLKNAIYGGGTLDILVSGVAHVKSHIGIPLSLGIICDNTLHLLNYPMQIVGKTCVVEGISTGWTGLVEMSSEVKERVMNSYKDQLAPVFNAADSSAQSSYKDIEAMMNLSEEIIEWHNF